MEVVENFWYPILDSNELKKNSFQQIKRFNQNFVLWRDHHGNLGCIKDRCAHKGVQLSQGHLINGEIVCAYHGIRYNTKGEATCNPALKHLRCTAPKLKVPSYTIKEKYNFIWLWRGKGKPKRDVPWYPDETINWTAYKTLSIKYPVGFYRLMESHMDGYHIDYLHKGKAPEIGKHIVNCKTETKGDLIETKTEYRKYLKKTGSIVTNSLVFPSIARATINSMDIANLFACAPIDNHTSLFMLRVHGKIFNWPIFGKYIYQVYLFYIRKFLLPDDFRVQSTHEKIDLGMRSDIPLPMLDQASIEYWELIRKYQKNRSSISPHKKEKQKILSEINH